MLSMISFYSVKIQSTSKSTIHPENYYTPEKLFKIILSLVQFKIMSKFGQLKMAKLRALVRAIVAQFSACLKVKTINYLLAQMIVLFESGG